MNSELEKLVVVGCSCGGKNAVNDLIPRINLNSSAIVIIPHVYRDAIYDSLKSKLKIKKTREGMDIKPGEIYILNKINYREGIGFKDNLFQIGDKPSGMGDVDYTMENAATQYQNRCIGIILSGYGNDGSIGAKFIKRYGGKVLVQIEKLIFFRKKKKYYVKNMPRNAQKATEVDFSGSLPKLANVLNKYLI